jgi:hypothetical protein
MFADCALYRSIHSDNDAKALKQDLDGLQRWKKDWLIKFHPRQETFGLVRG